MQNIDRILKNWNIVGKTNEISSKGYSGAFIFEVFSDSGDYILKSSKESPLGIHKVLDHLYSNGFNKIPKIIKTSENKTVVEEGDVFWELMTRVRGTTMPKIINDTQAFNLGKTLGNFHKSLENFVVDESTNQENDLKKKALKNRTEWWRELELHEKEMIKGWDLYGLVDDFIEKCEEITQKYLILEDWDNLQNNLPKNMLHADLWFENVFFVNDEVSSFIDPICSYGMRLEDLTTIIYTFSNFKESYITKIVKAYEESFPLTDFEKEKFKVLMILKVVRSGFSFLKLSVQEKDNFNSRSTPLKSLLEECLLSFERLENLDFKTLI